MSKTPRRSDGPVEGAGSDEPAPPTCEACNRPIFSGIPTQLVRPNGYVECVLCFGCAAKVKAVLLDLEKIFIIVEPKVFKNNTRAIMSALPKIVERKLYCTSPRNTHPMYLTISFIEGDRPGELLVAPGNGRIYRWSELRDDLEVLRG